MILRDDWKQTLPAHMKPSSYATKPTRFTLFLRTFVPWQIVRFLIVNIKMMRMTWLNKHSR